MISENILLYRKRMKWNQSTLASKMGMSQGTISLWEKGTSVPSVEQIGKLARVFGVSFADLVGDDPGFSASLVPDAPNTMPATPGMRIAVTGPDGMTQTLLHETAHYMGNRPSQAAQQEALAVLERDIRTAINPQRAARIAEAAEILQSMTDEEYKMALNVLRAMKK